MRRLLFLLFLCLYCIGLNAQNVPIEKFIGVWQTTKDHWTSNAMKISQEDGKIIVQIKNLISGKAILNGNRLEITTEKEVNYGKFWIGSWGGWYDSDGEWSPKRDNYILVGHSDGSYGTNGSVSGFYSDGYRYSKANKEIECLSVHVVYKYDGTLELYFTYHSDYYDRDRPLFYQGEEDDMYLMDPIVYTNW